MSHDLAGLLGLPNVRMHHARNHFDFTKPQRRILVVGPMGSGKTGFSAQIWRDAKIARAKDKELQTCMLNTGADLRSIFFVRSSLDTQRFSHVPKNFLAYRGGQEEIGSAIADISSSEELEQLVEQNPHAGTWIVDEASFYDERIAYVIHRLSINRGLVFVLPTLILNFRNTMFNTTANLLIEVATDIFPLTAYCEHAVCLDDANYTYRYYLVDGMECPAPYFDPLIIIGGDEVKHDGYEPNYSTRFKQHHVLPAKDYTYLVLKQLGEKAAAGNTEPLSRELFLLSNDPQKSQLGTWLSQQAEDDKNRVLCLRVLVLPCLAERALIFLFVEQNLISENLLRECVHNLGLNRDYTAKRLIDNRRPVVLE